MKLLTTSLKPLPQLRSTTNSRIADVKDATDALFRWMKNPQTMTKDQALSCVLRLNLNGYTVTMLKAAEVGKVTLLTEAIMPGELWVTPEDHLAKPAKELRCDYCEWMWPVAAVRLVAGYRLCRTCYTTIKNLTGGQ